MAWLPGTSALSPVSRVAAVGRADGVQPAPEVRGSDPVQSIVRRPEPAQVPDVDVARFQALLSDSPPTVPSFDAARWASSAHSQVPRVEPLPEVTPADRIYATLRHLATLRGL